MDPLRRLMNRPLLLGDRCFISTHRRETQGESNVSVYDKNIDCVTGRKIPNKYPL